MTDKQRHIASIIQTYLTQRLGGEDNIWEWIVADRFQWNGGSSALKVSVWQPRIQLEVAVFLKSTWGVGWKRNGGLAWKFKYTDKEIDNLLHNEQFIEAMERYVLSYVKEQEQVEE